MADKQISDLTTGTRPDGSEELHVKQGANSRKLTTRDLAEIGASITTQSGTTYAPAVTDVGNWIRFTNGAAITITINNSIFSANDEIIFEQAGSGVFTVAAGAGVTLNSSGGLLSSNGQYSVVGIKFLSASVAVVFGDLA